MAHPYDEPTENSHDFPIIIRTKGELRPISAHGLSHHTMEHMPFGVAIADAARPDYPLVYVNRAFEQMTGYHRSAVLGRNCRLLQGEETCEEHRLALRQGLAERRDRSIS